LISLLRPVARAGIDLPLRMTVPLVLVALALLGLTEAARPLLHAALGTVRGG
jgi:hypothetical protein